MKKDEFCTCKTEEQGEHICPYKEEICSDDTLCSCCDYCTLQCALDI